MARLPQVGSDDGTWGDLLNEYLQVSHDANGGIKNGVISETQLDAAAQAKLNGMASGGVTAVNTRTGAVTLTSSDVGLGNVNNTSDANKPVSSATQTALDGKAALSHTHTASQISDATAIGRTILTAADATAVKTALSLNNLDNTSDANKPVSTATQTALNLKADATTVGAKVLLINDVGSLPAGTPAGVIVVVKS